MALEGFRGIKRFRESKDKGWDAIPMSCDAMAIADLPSYRANMRSFFPLDRHHLREEADRGPPFTPINVSLTF